MAETSKLTVDTANVSQNLVFARLSVAARDAHFAANPPEIGMLIFNDDDKVLEFWNGSEWKLALGNRTGGGGAQRYEFNSFEYDATETSATGPSLATVVGRISGNDAWKNNTEYLNVSGGVWSWTPPGTGNYKIECWGAQGGRSNYYGPAGGLGVYATGTVNIQGGTVLKIVVGQKGGSNGYDCGGGGGTYVCEDDNTPLVIAGGGGGGSASGMNGPGPQNGTTSETGGSTAYGPGGSNGAGGGGNNGAAGGGGGTTGNGNGSWGGQGLSAGSQGGSGTSGGSGGFGGGGGGGQTNGAGGGGGYGGGAMSRWSYYAAGGGSYVTSDAQSVVKTAGQKSNAGKIKITKV